MKVLITTDWYKPVINGVVTSVVSLADGLTALGAEVRILTLSGDSHSHTDGAVTYLGSIGVGKIYPNARLKTAPSSKCVRELVEWHPDIVHSQCEFSSFFLARKIAEACNCPLVHTYHTVYEDFTHYFSPSVRFGKYMAATFTRRILAKADSVIVPTGKVQDMLLRYGVKTPVTVIPSGLKLTQFEKRLDGSVRDTMRAELGLGRNDKVLVYLGRLAQEKNVDELLELVALEPNAHLRLLLVGDGPYRTQLEEKAKALHLGGCVIFAGMVKPSQVAQYYALGDIFVSASQSETQGLTYVEAMAAGLPLLCRADPCLSDVIQNGINGLLYAGRDEFATKLHRLMKNGEFRRTLGEAAKETAFRNFSSLGFARRVLEEYKLLLRSNCKAA
ncbi:MAG: glycosyltransferase family 4 protein [Oscillospiraceae bacterium]|nr:glycosyltransferase family 4 protein [Oscillospiraceae bacterium]